MPTVSEEFNSILNKYKKHKLDTYKVLELLGTDYTFTDYGADTEDKRYTQLLNCGTFLQFKKRNENGIDIYHLTGANFCRQRICPMCQFRKSEKMFAQVLRVVKHLEQDYRFLHLVLTIPNASDGVELQKAITILYKGFNTFLKYKKVRGAFKGVLRCLEISYNYSSYSFHPHLHCLVVVNKSSFNDSKTYLSYDVLRELWTKAVRSTIASLPFGADFAKTDELLQIYIRACKVGDYSGVAEVCKYCLKPLDLDKTEDEYSNKRMLLTLWHTLKGKRFIQKYGVVKDTFKLLNCDDEDNLLDEELKEAVEINLTWNSDYQNYRGLLD
jgi:plasmid rolling circle replication initiator protein Rep